MSKSDVSMNVCNDDSSGTCTSTCSGELVFAFYIDELCAKLASVTLLNAFVLLLCCHLFVL